MSKRLGSSSLAYIITRALLLHYHYYINLKSDLSEVSSCSEVAWYFVFWHNMQDISKPVQPHSISWLIWFLMVSLLGTGRGQGKGTLKQKPVKFNARWVKGATCEISSIKEQSVCEGDSKGLKYFTGFPQESCV